MHARYSLKFKVLLVVLSRICALVFIEVLLAIVRPALIFTKINIISRGAEYSLSPNCDLISVPKPSASENNSYGHRGNHFPFEPTRPFRILFMDDSIVEGYRTKPEERFTEQLDSQLGEIFEIVNLGVRG